MFGLRVALLALILVGQPFGRALAAEVQRERPPIWFTLHGGGLIPARGTGAGVDNGAQAVGSLGYELNRDFRSDAFNLNLVVGVRAGLR